MGFLQKRRFAGRSWFWIGIFVLVPWHLAAILSYEKLDRPPLPIGDGPDYECIAFSLSRGEGFRFAWDDPAWKSIYLSQPDAKDYVHLHRDDVAGVTTARPPLFPIMIATVYQVFGRGPEAFRVVRILSALCLATAGALAMAIAYRVTENATLSKRAAGTSAVMALGLALFDRTLRSYACDFLSEPLALLLTTLFALFAVAQLEQQRTWRLAATAVLFGAMILTRSMLIFWLPGVLALVVCSAEGKRRLAAGTLFFSLTVLTIGPWCVRNCLWLDRWMPMGTQGTISLLGGYSDEAMSDGGNWHPEAEQRLRQRVMSDDAAKLWDSLEREAVVATEAGREIRAWVASHYDSMPKLMWTRLTTHWGPYFGKSLVWKTLIAVGFAMLLFSRRREAIWLVGLPVVSSLTVMFLYETGGRFLVPLYGLLYAVAGVGTAIAGSRLYGFLRRR